LKSPNISAPWGWGILFFSAAFIFWCIAFMLSSQEKSAELYALLLSSCAIGVMLGAMVLLHQATVRSRRQTERALAESEGCCRSITATSSEGIILQGADGKILLANARAEKMLGLPADNMQGKTLVNPAWRAIYQDGSPLPQDMFPSAVTLRNGKPCTDVVMGIQKPNGGLGWLRINTQPLRRPGEKKIFGVAASIVDITEQRRVEEALQRQTKIFEEIQDAVVVTDLDGRVKLWNKGAENIFGHTRDEALGAEVSTLYGLEDQEVLKRHTTASFKEKTRPAAEVWAHRKSGERCFIHLSLSLLREQHGTPYGMVLYASDITELKRVEEALRESDAHTRLIVDTAMDAVITMDAAGRIVGWNVQAEATFGWKTNEVIGKPLAETIMPPEYREAHLRGLSHYLATGESKVLDRRFEIAALRKNGEIFPVELSITAILNPNGPVTFSAFLRDISERKQAEENLRRSEERYRTLVERMTDGLYRSTPDGKFIEVNPAMVKMLGYASKKELMDIDIKSQLYFDVKEREEMVDVLREAGKDEIEVFRLRRKDGHEVWVEDHGRLVYDSHGTVLYHEGILRDITARLKAEKALRESEERFRTLYDDNPFMYFTVDAEGIVLSVNRFGAEQLGYKIEELLGKPVVNVFHEEDKALAVSQLKICLNNRQTVHHWELRKRRKDGSVMWVRETARATHDANNRKIVIIVCEDISDRKKAK
jgi:PAS domain S-box-containing protein